MIGVGQLDQYLDIGQGVHQHGSSSRSFLICSFVTIPPRFGKGRKPKSALAARLAGACGCATKALRASSKITSPVVFFFAAGSFLRCLQHIVVNIKGRTHASNANASSIKCESDPKSLRNGCGSVARFCCCVLAKCQQCWQLQWGGRIACMDANAGWNLSARRRQPLKDLFARPKRCGQSFVCRYPHTRSNGSVPHNLGWLRAGTRGDCSSGWLGSTSWRVALLYAEFFNEVNVWSWKARTRESATA